MADFWKERCLQAEALLAKARSALMVTAPRQAVLQQLGELKAGQWMATSALQKAAELDRKTLRRMEECGLVESRPCADNGREMEWRLAPLVVPEVCGVLESGVPG